jgi:CRISP-associated protein Cas1
MPWCVPPSRALVASGLLPVFGVNHASLTNEFNLADDIVEPFRPFIDRLVWHMTDSGRNRDGETTVEERRKLAASLLEGTRFDSKIVTLLVATERAAESLVRAMEANSAALLLLPRLVA